MGQLSCTSAVQTDLVTQESFDSEAVNSQMWLAYGLKTAHMMRKAARYKWLLKPACVSQKVSGFVCYLQR